MSMFFLLVIFYFVDRHNYRRAPSEIRRALTETSGIKIGGWHNLIFLVVVLTAVFVQRPLFVREVLMIMAGIASYFATPKRLREANDFSFAPLEEVGWLFLGIFLTMVPVLDFMRFHAAELPIDSSTEFYWVSGGLSSVLDNAPTYLAFLANAMGRQNLSVENTVEVQRFLNSGAGRA
jgi:Na+/H+ antiporter NhaD/arsenite permease-like protein